MSGILLRRLLHASTAVILLIIPVASWTVFRSVVISGTVLVVAVEIARLRVPAIHARLAVLVPVFRESETHRVSGAAWLWLAYSIASLLPAPAPAAGILVAALCDPAASVVGQRFGAAGRKTWAGSFGAFVVACVSLIALGFSWPAVAGAGALATVLERWPGPFDDNLLIAPGVAAAVLALA